MKTSNNSRGHGRIKLDEVDVQSIEERLRAKGLESPSKNKLNPSQVAGLYHVPKSLEEQRQDDRERARLRDEHRPRHPSFRVALATSGLFIVTAYFITNIGAMWATGQVGTFFSFFIAIALAFAAVGCFYYLDRIFFLYGKSLRRFAAVYAFIFVFSVGASVLVGYAVPLLGGYAWLLLATTIHFLIIWLLLRKVFVR